MKVLHTHLKSINASQRSKVEYMAYYVFSVCNCTENAELRKPSSGFQVLGVGREVCLATT